jgi:hypothetical protein
MPEFCSCGAQLPPDALFCHKCGKPQREIVVPEPVVEHPTETIPPPPEAPAPLPLNFRNPVAVRVALIVAIIATALFFVLPFLNWIVAGFFAVFFYRRRTGSLLNVSGGVRLGWITGIIMYTIFAIPVLAQQLRAALTGRLAPALQEQLRSLPGQDPKTIEQVTQFFQTGPGIVFMFVFSLVGLFLFVTGFSMAGGALGAKMMGRSS